MKKPAVKKTTKKPAAKARGRADGQGRADAGRAGQGQVGRPEEAATAKKPSRQEAAPRRRPRAAPAKRRAKKRQRREAKPAPRAGRRSKRDRRQDRRPQAADASAAAEAARAQPQAAQPSAPPSRRAGADARAGRALATPNGFVPRKPGRGTPKYFVAPVQAPLPPPTSRFADRFAPPRPPTRQMNKQEHDTPTQRTRPIPKLANAWKTKAGRDLTDDELLAMPESEYMNEKQLEFFRMKLQALKDDLLEQRRRDHRAPARGHLDRSRSGRPGDDRGRARARAAHARPRAQAPEEDLPVARAGSSRASTVSVTKPANPSASAA